MTLAVAVQHQRAVLPALGRYELALAASELDVYEAQRLRYRVFHDELGARLTSRIPGLDCDFFDPYCEHLIVRDRVEQRVVGCYRVLTPEGAKRVGGLYSEQEYDLVRLDPLRERMVEVGRACIAPGHRHGGVIALLLPAWRAIWTCAATVISLGWRRCRCMRGSTRFMPCLWHSGRNALHRSNIASRRAGRCLRSKGRHAPSRHLARRSSRPISTRGRGCAVRPRWMRISGARTCRYCCRPSGSLGATRGIFGRRWGALAEHERDTNGRYATRAPASERQALGLALREPLDVDATQP